jgi:hypothetical protein
MRLTGTRLQTIIRQEVRRTLNESMSGARDEMDMGPADPIELGAYTPPRIGVDVRAAWNKMPRKPVGLIFDVSEMEGTGGGSYPVFYSTGAMLSQISPNAGDFAYDLLEYVFAHGVLPKGIYLAGPNPDTGVFEITNRA